MHDFITGIQQIGIGVCNGPQSLKAYAQLFGMNALVFNDISEASLMTHYTGGETYRRQAMLSLNMQGGGGFEIWQFINRQPAQPATAPAYGDTGIYAPKIKAPDIAKAHAFFSGTKEVHTSALLQAGGPHFWVTDSTGLHFQVVESEQWFCSNGGITGGVTGAVIGVSDMDRACAFYQWLLQTSKVVYDEKETFGRDAGKNEKYRRVLLSKQATSKGAFGKLLGPVQLELVQCLDRKPKKIYADRFWGDCGFIHLCFDVIDMCGLKEAASKSGYPFTIDSINSFGMEKAAGRFCYMEDPDGTLIELVETHKVPILKNWGIYLNLKKRNLQKPLPDWMIRLLALSKVK
jgi:catechol 2,3-dioxygenase-like lactoylglutathione lyase family enzyme